MLALTTRNFSIFLIGNIRCIDPKSVGRFHRWNMSISHERSNLDFPISREVPGKFKCRKPSDFNGEFLKNALSN